MIKKANLYCACTNNNSIVKRPKKIVLSKKSAPAVSSTPGPTSNGISTCTSKKYTDTIKNSTTKSEFSVGTKVEKLEKVNSKDLFTKCGDNPDVVKTNNRNTEKHVVQPRPSSSCGSIKKQQSRVTIPSQKPLAQLKRDPNGTTQKPLQKQSEPLQQYYKNKNYKDTESVRHFPKKISNLDPIKESSENRFCGSNHASSDEIAISSTNSDIVTYIDADNPEVVAKIKNFRDENYFECHSARARIEDKVPITDIANHKCVYRFYLNDRLFPVPVNYDRNNTIRCLECLLPFKGSKKNHSDKFLNGTIQCKIQIGNETDLQDLTILLPVKENLIVKQKRMEARRSEDTVYFGVIKLSEMGGTLVDRNVEEESLALRHQKGYKEYDNGDEYSYKCVDENEVIYV